jgi:GNAT superfamily N-acetyltransferase
MIDAEYQLRAPANDDEWKAFHAIRRKVLFENRGKSEIYNETHPDDSNPRNHPLVLLYRDTVIGVIRIDVSAQVAWFRRIAIREDLQRLGHGRALLRLAEDFAKALGCSEIRSNAAVEAVGFYERCGYARDHSANAPPNSVRVTKSFFRIPWKVIVAICVSTLDSQIAVVAANSLFR